VVYNLFLYDKHLIQKLLLLRLSIASSALRRLLGYNHKLCTIIPYLRTKF
jgi:hypothetical protein